MIDPTRNYEELAQNAIEQIKGETKIAKTVHAEKYILPEHCEALEMTVRAFIPLIEFKNNNNLSRTIYILHLQYVLPQIVSEEFMTAYFLKLLIEGHNDSSSWTQPGKLADFKRICGLTYCYKEDYGGQRRDVKSHRYHQLLAWFTRAYEEEFTIDLHYPQDLIKEVDRCFEAKEPMPHTYKMFTDLYLGRRDVPYLKFIAEALYARYGEERMRAYLEAVIAEYAKEFGHPKDGQAYLMDIVKFIFGQHFAGTAFILSTYKNRYSRFNTNLLLLKGLIMKTAWPYIYAHYAAKHDLAYELMRLSEEEKADYDRIYYSVPVKKNMATKVRVLTEFEDMILPNGSSHDDIIAAVKRYYLTAVAPSRVIPSRKTAFKEIVRISSAGSRIVKDLKYLHSNTAVRPFLAALMEDEENALRARFVADNCDEIASDKDVLQIYYFHKGAYRCRKIDFSVLPVDFRREAKMYCRTVLKKVTPNAIKKVNKAIRFMSDMAAGYGIRRCMDIKKGHICIWLHKKQLCGAKPTTITDELCIARNAIGAVMKQKNYALRPQNNPALTIRFYGARDHVDHRPVIPDDIQIFIEDHLWELDEESRIMYQLLKQTCWRYDDAANLRVSGLYDIGDTEYAGIRTMPSKTKKQRIKHAVGEYLEDVIPQDLYAQIMDYIEGTAKIRDKYETDLVFFSCFGGMAHQIGEKDFSNSINGLLSRYGIKSIDETYTGFSSSQPRATSATALIESGEDLPVVQHKLGHLHAETTARHYAHVREAKLAELDKEFFDHQFSALFDPDRMMLLTKTERQALYRDFKYEKKRTELGSCKKSPCGGECGRHGSIDCVECTKLLTGPQNLPAWQRLLEVSDHRLSQFVSFYEAKGISPDQYKDFEEYKDELRQNSSLRDVIAKIIKWKEERE